MEAEIHTWKRRSGSGYQLMKHLFETPFVTISDVQKITGLSKKSAGDLVKLFEEKKYISNLSGRLRFKIYVFKSYMDLFNDE